MLSERDVGSDVCTDVDSVAASPVEARSRFAEPEKAACSGSTMAATDGADAVAAAAANRSGGVPARTAHPPRSGPVTIHTASAGGIRTAPATEKDASRLPAIPPASDPPHGRDQHSADRHGDQPQHPG